MSHDDASVSNCPPFAAELLDSLYVCLALSEPIYEQGQITDFRCIYVNDSYLRLMKRTREEVVRLTMLQRYPGLREAGMLEKIINILETGDTLDLEYHMVQDGLDVFVRLVVKRLGARILFSFHDIAQRKRSETQLRRVNAELEERVLQRTAELRKAQERLQQALEAEQLSNRTKGEFLAMISHDLRSPLVAIQGYVSLLTSESLNPLQVEQLNVIDHCAEALLRMLDDLLRFSRLEAGQFKFESEPFILSSLLEELIDIFRPAARQKNLALNLHVDSSLPALVMGDPAQLRRVFNNLVGNAIKFTDQGEVTLRVWTEPQLDPAAGWLLHAEITDTGPGLDSAQVRRLFLPYAQGDGESRRPRSGVGLGLAICQRLCELMGGSVSYERAPQQGSRFSFVVKLGAVSPVESLG